MEDDYGTSGVDLLVNKYKHPANITIAWGFLVFSFLMLSSWSSLYAYANDKKIKESKVRMWSTVQRVSVKTVVLYQWGSHFIILYLGFSQIPANFRNLTTM